MSAWIVKRALWVYFLLAYVLTWSGSAIHLALSHGGNATGLSTLAQVPAALLVLLGPAIAACIAAGLEHGRHGLARTVRPLLVWKVGWRFWAFVLAYPIAHHLAVVGIRWAASGPRPRFFDNATLPQNSVLAALAVGVGVNLVRGFGEEVGWRGYALPRMQSRWGALTASLVLGMLWALWHWHPANMSAFGWHLIGHFFAVLPATVVYTWLYNHTRGSLLVAVVYHMWQDVTDYIVPLGVLEGDSSGWVIAAIVNWTVAAVLAASWRRRATAKKEVIVPGAKTP